MRAESIPAVLPHFRLRSRRLLGLAGDDALVEQMRRGNEAAFEVCFERYGAGILGFCTHMLGSREEAEDAVQQAFASAFRSLGRGGDHELALKPWLYTIARNRCLSLLRARREQAGEPTEPASIALDEQVEHRVELRQLLRDVHELPDEQRAALLLSQAGDLAHTEIAAILGCDVARVKALVFRARTALIHRRNARDTPCEAIREQLANLRGGSLRRTELREHLRDCPGCRAYQKQVRYQRRMLAAALPVTPSIALKSSVLAGLGAGATGGGLTVGGLGGFGTATLAKLAAAGALTGGGVVAGTAAIDRPDPPPAGAGAYAPAPEIPQPVRRAAPAVARGPAATSTASTARKPVVATAPAQPAGSRSRRRVAVGGPVTRRDRVRDANTKTPGDIPLHAERPPAAAKKAKQAPAAGDVPRQPPARGHGKPAADNRSKSQGPREKPATRNAPPHGAPANRTPANPKPANPKPANPKPANPKPAKPQPAQRKPAEAGAPTQAPPAPTAGPPAAPAEVKDGKGANDK